VASTGTSTAITLLKSGFGLLPLIGGLIGLFGGGQTAAPAPLVKYAMPTALDIEAVDTGQGLTNADYDQMGMLRQYSGRTGSASTRDAAGAVYGDAGFDGSRTDMSATPARAMNASPAAAFADTPGVPTERTASTTQITVNVQAMDARSFMDRSADIAAAVRSAMLNLNTINDVVTDL
jgi:hypothetical protein